MLSRILSWNECIEVTGLLTNARLSTAQMQSTRAPGQSQRQNGPGRLARLFGTVRTARPRLGCCAAVCKVWAGYLGAQSAQSPAQSGHQAGADFLLVAPDAAFGFGLAGVFAGSIADGTVFD